MVRYNVNTCDQICNELQVHFTQKCPNNCPFCVDALNRGENYAGKPNVEAIFANILLYADHVKEVGISGGEPMIYIDELLKLVSLIKKYTNLRVGIMTSLPDTCYNKSDVFYNILEKVDMIGITPQHWKEDVADKIRGHKSGYDRQAFYVSMPYKDKITMNINVCSPYLCEKDDILACISHYNKMGYKNIKLCEMFDRDDMYVSIEDALGIDGLKSPFGHGCSTKHFDITPWIPDFKGNLTLKRVCFLKSKKCKANLADLVKMSTRKLFQKKYFFGVIYENGNIFPYWH